MGCAWHLAALLLLLTLSAAAFGAPDTSKYKLDFSTELRVFPQEAFDPRQTDATLSFSALGRADYDWDQGRTKLAISPFVRHDSADTQRSHADLREFELRHRSGNFDWRAGIGRVFWGTTESEHLVDIINQTDAVEDVDSEQKLGQPMASLAWSSPYGVFTGFVLPYFRERTLVGIPGRLRARIPYDLGTAQYESSRGDRHVDTALRWNYSGDNIDAGIYQFVGTAREPRLALLPARLPGKPEPTLLPIYDQIHQTGVDLNTVNGSWIWKLEALHQINPVRNYNAAVGGFEYTLDNVDTDAPSIGLLSELQWDSRGRTAPSAFQRDIFFGLRVSLNDVEGSEMLAGVQQDLQHSGRALSIDASRRVGNDARLSLKLRLFQSTYPYDPISAISRDTYLQAEYTQHF